MLYVTTRSRWNSYTAQWALTKDRAEDGGFFVPMTLPQFTREQIDALSEQSFYATVAQVLNQFFSTDLTEQNVRFVLGHTPVKLVDVSHRLVAGETWHNSAGSFTYFAEKLCRQIQQNSGEYSGLRNWPEIAARIAFLFGFFGQLQKQGRVSVEKTMDVVTAAGDFTAPMAAWYARKMGLPIGVIVCGCNENGAPWELLHRGELRTSASTVVTDLPLADHALPDGLERLLNAALGDKAVGEYLTTCERGGLYVPEELDFQQLRQGVFVSVVGRRRLDMSILNVYTTNSYILGPYAALGYAGCTDLRAISGGSPTAVLLCDRSPMLDKEYLCRVMAISETTLQNRLK